MGTVIITADIDWAPDKVLEDTIEIFEKFDIKCSFFATHETSVLANLDPQKYEIGIHPNFNPILFQPSIKTVDDVLIEMLEMFPEAKGVRSHSLTQSSQILGKFHQAGMIYESNTFLPYEKNINPVSLWNGMIRIPYNWEDDAHWDYGNNFDDLKIDISTQELSIFDFHPIHIYLNTEKPERYIEAKKYFKKPSKLIEYRNISNTPGTRDLLISLLEQIHEKAIKTNLMIELANDLSQNFDE